MADQQAAALEIRALSKGFNGVAVLRGVDLTIRPGEILGLVGHNGSGKSTLVKVLAGIHEADPGSHVSVWGHQVTRTTRLAARMAIIHQDLGLVDRMTVLENIGVSYSYGSRRSWRIDWSEERARCHRLESLLGVEIDLDELVGDLSPSDRAVCAILRGLYSVANSMEPALVVMDEPTAALGYQESRRLLDVVRSLADSGSGVMLITHRLNELKSVSDQIAVLRDGRIVATTPTREITTGRVAELMLGQTVTRAARPAPSGTHTQVRLRVAGLTGSLLRGVSFEVRVGEILGFTGLAGMGQEELPYLLAGGRPTSVGTVEILTGGEDDEPGESFPRAGVALVPGNRQRDGLWLEASAYENLSLPVLKSHVQAGRLRSRAELGRAEELMHEFGVRPVAPAMSTAFFSGGNQQKMLLAKWFQIRPAVLVLEDPTQGVDVGAREDILHLVREAAADGAGVVVCSSDVDELVEVCDRVICLRYGRVEAELAGDQLTAQLLFEASAGQIEMAGPAGNTRKELS